MATIERRERQSGVVYLADVRIRGFPRQKKTFKRLTDAKIWTSRYFSDQVCRQGISRRQNIPTMRQIILMWTGKKSYRTKGKVPIDAA